MKAALVVFIVVLTASLIGWMCAGDTAFPLPQTLPFLGGYEPGVYDGAAFLMLVVAVSGLMRMRRKDDDG